jgi:hypothetical protein
MGIETAALGGLAAAGTGAAAAGTAAGAGAALTGAEAIAAGLTAAEAGTAVAAGTGAAGAAQMGAQAGAAMDAFIAANQGFGTMTIGESIGGLASAIGSNPIGGIQGLMAARDTSPILSGLGDLAKGLTAAPDQPQQVKQSSAPAAYDVQRPNQNPGLTQQSGLMQSSNYDSSASSLSALGFQDGGRVPRYENIFERTRREREEAAGLREPSNGGGGGITINVGTPEQRPNPPRTEAPMPSIGELAESILQLLRGNSSAEDGYANGGRVRSGASDVLAGGEIRGPKSHSGRDNQIIKVAGGEGILPKDVMDVPGVADLVQNLITTFHTPIK